MILVRLSRAREVRGRWLRAGTETVMDAAIAGVLSVRGEVTLLDRSPGAERMAREFRSSAYDKIFGPGRTPGDGKREIHSGPSDVHVVGTSPARPRSRYRYRHR